MSSVGLPTNLISFMANPSDYLWDQYKNVGKWIVNKRVKIKQEKAAHHVMGFNCETDERNTWVWDWKIQPCKSILL